MIRDIKEQRPQHYIIGTIIGGFSHYTIGGIVFGMGYILAWFGGVIIGIEAWLVGVMLSVNTGVFDSKMVQAGFGISLSIANLGFVFGIIIIALATILHRETYGVKQLLWKLVVSAIFVNFGLVIMAPIFGFTNSLSQYFLNCVDPTVGCNNPKGATVITSMNHFAQALVGSFNPQNGFTALNQSTSSGTAGPNSLQGAFADAGQGLASLMVPIFSLFSVAAALIIFAITLATLIIMLLVRYIYIAILAILMPFAWLMWVFPKLSSHWSKWWHNFFKWSFFAPMVLFFLYLAMITAQSMSNGTAIQSQSFATYTSSSNVVWANVSGLFSNIFTPIIATLLSQFVFTALCVGGIFAANSMGIAGADMAMKAVGAVKDSATGYVGKWTQKGTRAAYRAADRGVSAVSKRAGGSGAGLTQRLQGSRIRPLAMAGRAIAPVQDNRGMVEQAAKSVPNDKKIWTENIKGSMSTEMQMAYLQKGDKEGWIKPNMEVGNTTIEKYLDKNKDTFKNYGQAGDGKLEESLRFKTYKLDQDIRQENQELQKKNKPIEDKIQKKAGLNDEEMQFYTTANKKDVEANFTADDKKRWYALEARAKEAKAALAQDPENPKGADEQKEYEGNKEKMGENEGKLLRMRLKDPETTAAAFNDDESAREKLRRENKEIPETLSKENVDARRNSILMGMAKNYSAANARSLFDAMAKANNLPYFEAAVNEMKEQRTDQYVVLQETLKQNKDLRRWMQNNSGKALFGGLRELFGLEEIEDKNKKTDEQPQPGPATP